MYRKNIYLILIIQFLNSMYIIKIINTLYYQSLGINLENIGIILAVYQISKILFEIPTGIFADRYGRKYSLFLGYICMELFLILTATGQNIYHFMIGTLLQGIGISFISGSDNAIMVDSLIKNGEENKIGFFTILKQICMYFSLAIGALLGGYFSSKLDYKFLYLIQAIIFFGVIFSIFFIKEIEIYKNVKKNNLLQNLKEIKKLVTEPIPLFCLSIYLTVAVCFIPIDSYYSNYLIMNKITEKMTGIIMFYQQLVAAVVVLVLMKYILKISDEYKLKQVFILPFCMIGCLFISFYYSNIYVTLLFFSGAQFFFILMNSLIFEIFQRNISSEYRASCGSIFSFGLGGVASFSHYFYGLISSKIGIKSAFLYFILGSFILLIINGYRFKEISLIKEKYELSDI